MKSTSRLMTAHALGLLLALWATGAATAAEHFLTEVRGVASATDFRTLTAFATPAGTGTGRQTLIKLVTDTPLADITFRIEPESAGVNGSRAPVDLQVLFDGGPSVFPGNLTEDDLAETVVAQVLLAEEVTDATVADGYAMVRVTIEYDDGYTFPAAETWQLKVKETTADREYFGFAGQDEADVTQPRIGAVSDRIDFGEVQQNVGEQYSPVLAVHARNVGTAELDIESWAIDPTGTFGQRHFGPQDLAPAAALENLWRADERTGLWVDARPGALGPAEATLTLESTDGGEAELTLAVIGVNLFAHLLMDTSGSMGRTPDGDNCLDDADCLKNRSRLAAAKQAGQQINNWIDDFSGGQAFLGLTIFPDSYDDAANRADANVVDAIDEARNNHPSIGAAFGPPETGGLRDENGTPMEAGIIAALADMDNRISGDQPPAPEERDLLRQAILLFTDGGETGSSNARAQIPVLDNADVLMYTVGYGIPGSASVDHVLLADLANGPVAQGPQGTQTRGAFYDANSLDPFAIKNAFKMAMTDWLGLEVVVDPEGTIRAGQDRQHTACLDDEAYAATFSVDWDRVAPGGVDVTLTSPTGDVITPESADDLVSYHEGDTYAMYVLRGDRIRGGAGAGLWTLNLTGGSSIPGGEDTTYSYNVLAQSRVAAEPTFSLSEMFTGDTLLLELEMANIVAGKLDDLEVSVELESPGASFQTYLARTPVDPALIYGEQQPVVGSSLWPTAHAADDNKDAGRRAAVPARILGESASLAHRKAYALREILEEPFAAERETAELELVDDGTGGDRVAGDGVFTARMPRARYDGVYRYFLEVRDLQPERRTCYQREHLAWKYADIGLAEALIPRQVAWEPVRPELFSDPMAMRHFDKGPREGHVRQALVFAPEDELGNAWGLGREDELEISLENAEAIGPVFANLDGTYIRVIEYQQGTTPRVAIGAAGVEATLAGPEVEETPWQWILLLVLAALLLLVLVLRRPAP